MKYVFKVMLMKEKILLWLLLLWPLEFTNGSSDGDARACGIASVVVAVSMLCFNHSCCS